jgi:hypothetical protein
VAGRHAKLVPCGHAGRCGHRSAAGAVLVSRLRVLFAATATACQEQPSCLALSSQYPVASAADALVLEPCRGADLCSRSCRPPTTACAGQPRCSFRWPGCLALHHVAMHSVMLCTGTHTNTRSCIWLACPDPNCPSLQIQMCTTHRSLASPWAQSWAGADAPFLLWHLVHHITAGCPFHEESNARSTAARHLCLHTLTWLLCPHMQGED